MEGRARLHAHSHPVLIAHHFDARSPALTIPDRSGDKYFTGYSSQSIFRSPNAKRRPLFSGRRFGGHRIERYIISGTY
jgi:hypothetical protein